MSSLLELHGSQIQDDVEFCDTLPKTMAGGVLRREPVCDEPEQRRQ